MDLSIPRSTKVQHKSKRFHIEDESCVWRIIAHTQFQNPPNPSLILPPLPPPTTMPQPRASRILTLRTIFDGTVKPIRDRGLDHAIERERNLKPLISLKNLIKRETSKSLPISLIRRSLSLPFRPIEFTRKYPSVFELLPPPCPPHSRNPPPRLRGAPPSSLRPLQTPSRQQAP